VSTLVILDTGVLGLVTHTSDEPEPRQCKAWLKGLLEKGYLIYVPEIADYELRRKLLHRNKQKSIQRLDQLKSTIGYVPITTRAMLKAAEFWAEARKAGKPTADEKALDGDVILAAQAVLLLGPGDQPIIATTNVGHLSLFTDARKCQEIE